MTSCSSQKIAFVLALSTHVLSANISNADLVTPLPLWAQSSLYVYVCSDTEKISSMHLEEFYADIPQVSANFKGGSEQPFVEQAHYGDIVIVSIAPQRYSINLKHCLEKITFFPRQWIEEITQHANEIGTVPENLANTPLGKYYEPLNASWKYRYSDGVVLSSYVYLSEKYFSYEDAVRGALQFYGSSKTNTKDTGGN